MEQQYEFDAFISYSHHDMKWGRWLQKALENWHIPSGFRRVGSRKHLRIFRDQTDLAGVELQESIQRELRLSRYLIVIASPHSAVSPWVAAEIAFFKSLGREQSIIPFIVEGEPETDRTEQECYSPELRNVADHHYLGANVQELGRHKAFLRLLSIVLDIRFDRLVDRDRQKRALRFSVAGGVTALVLTVTSVLLWRNIQKENENRLLMYGNALITYAQTGQVTPEMIRMLELSGNAGEAQACLTLGDFYQNGTGIPADETQAFHWYQLAAQTGSTDGLVAVGNCYANGIGTAADMKLAFQFYKQAAEQGNLSGIFSTALCLRDGEGVDADPQKAFELFSRAAEAGYPLAVSASAYCCMTGLGTEKDPERAFAWTSKLAETGDVSGMYNLAMMYQNGYGTQEDPEQALKWYRKAAEAGDADSMYMVGWCLENRYGTADPAQEWYRRAYEAGKEFPQP